MTLERDEINKNNTLIAETSTKKQKVQIGPNKTSIKKIRGKTTWSSNKGKVKAVCTDQV